ncbi:hypothetical protein [Nostocoides sp. Soil756]|jgi:hypothetical protein|uniref:hypothetical protein n=1 Tax=Nostocoides sp. Soil756 TaxID=1736399 RepID=UPI000700B201|nr:hypothetical protein [Tetrasphaera sp. Soil756]KRE62442.1 hypothetical protein ASG78_05275 [Tetrasphaera sp. Soil756]
MEGPTQQLTLVADERRYDLVVPVGTRVTEVLAVLGISSSAAPSSVATAAGHVYGPQDRIGEDLPTGAVLTVVRTTTHRLHRGVVSLDRSSSAPGARASAPAWAGGSRSRGAADDEPGVSLVDESTRRRDDTDDDATVSRASLHAGRRRGPGPRAARSHAGRVGRASRVGRAGRGSRASRAFDGGALPALVVGTSLVSLLAGVLAADVPAGDHATSLDAAAARGVTALVLVVAAVAAALLTTGRRRGSVVVRLVAVPALAVSAGLLVPLGDSPSRLGVTVTLAATLGAVVLALASSDGSNADRAERTAMTCLGGVAVVVAASVMWGQPPTAAAAVVLGLAPLVIRALPSAGLDVDPTQLLDTDRLSTTVWSVRERHAGRRRRVTGRDVRERVDQARSVVSVGTAYLALLAAGAGWVLALAPALSTLAPWAQWVAPAVAAAAVGYQARHVRDRLARSSMLAAAASLTTSATVAVVGWDDGWFWAVVGAALTLGVVALVAALALAGGWASPRMSRLADRVESLAVVLVLPLSVIAAGAVEALRRLTSG